MNDEEEIIPLEKIEIKGIEKMGLGNIGDGCNSCGMDNYFDIISFKDRINEKKSIPIKLKNMLVEIISTVIAYFFGSAYSGYVFFLRGTYEANIISFQFLTGFLVLVILANLWGSHVGIIGGILGEIIYQFVSIGTIRWEFCLMVAITGLLAGLARYDKDKTIPNMRIMKFFYSLVVCVLINLAIFLFSGDGTASVVFTVSQIISFLFLGPIFIAVIDRLLKNGANVHNNVFRIVLTHHSELDADHAIPIDLGGYNLFLCTRCTGTIAGIIVGLFIEHILSFYRGGTIDSGFAFFMCVILPIPGLVDWGTQAAHIRKSNDKSRVITGILLGMAMHMLNFVDDMFVETLVLVSVYFGIFFALMYVRKKNMEKEEYVVEF